MTLREAMDLDPLNDRDALERHSCYLFNESARNGLYIKES